MYIIKKLEIEELLKRYPSELSTGQRQRVALARLMIKKPSLLLADEPTGSLDNKTAMLVLDVLKEMSKTSTVIIVSHDEALADKYADRIILLNGGHIESDNTGNKSSLIKTSTEISKPIRQTFNFAEFIKYSAFKGRFNLFKKVVMIIMFSLLITLSAAMIGFNQYDRNWSIYKTSDKYDLKAAEIKKISSSQLEQNLLLKDMIDLSVKYGHNILFKYDEYDLDLSLLQTTFIDPSDKDFYQVSYTSSLSVAQLEKLGFTLLSGSLAQKNSLRKEVVISKFLFEQIKKFGHTDIKTPITNYDSILNKSNLLRRCI